MDGSSSSSPRSGQTRFARTALAAVIATVGLIAVPGSASAATVTPVLNCTMPAAGGGFTAVLGWDNSTGQSVTIPHGRENRIVSGQYDGVQPTVFGPGRRNGAFSFTVTTTSATWTLGSAQLLIKPSEAPACPTSTELPEAGNGTGPAIAMVAAGVFGAVAVRRARRRALTAADAPAAGGHDDA